MARLGILGLGNMGEAIVGALLGSGFDRKDLLAFEVKKDRAQTVARRYRIGLAANARDLAQKARYILIAVKPQDAKRLLGAIAPAFDKEKLVISIMAGVTTSTILSMLQRPVKVIRIMPNICVKVGEGALGMTSNDLVPEGELEETKKMLAPLGRVVEVREDLMDAVTALSGSGPAFLLCFLEAMIDAGVNVGLPRDKASILAIQTIKGTIATLEAEKLHPTVMKEMVTSPGGTTIAGLTLLEEKGFRGSLIKAIEQARNRAKELSA
ncbi:MAG TPA: pyrroline-5-carboxylate reductase [Syntrophorhabdales bacterium]|nr:pyrroline-5-carboxylate reductase [Syntrophorhabdales bacterium]